MAKSRMYQIYELRDEIKKAIDNLSAVEASEKKLSAIIASSPEGKEFEDFTKGLASNWPGYESKRVALNTRLRKLSQIISMHEAQDESSAMVDDIVSLVLEGLGAVKPENKPEA